MIASTLSEPISKSRLVASATTSFSRTPGLRASKMSWYTLFHHRRRHVQERELVLALEHPRLEHDLLAVADLDAELLERERNGGSTT